MEHRNNKKDMSKHVRHHEASASTIRAVTPDSSAMYPSEPTALPSPNSFHSHAQSRFQSHDPYASVSNTDEESTVGSHRRKSKKKLKHNDQLHLDTSPNSFFEKTRKRLNSIGTSSGLVHRQEESPMSIGFPSVVQASVFPDLQDVRQQLPRTPRRTISSDTATTSNTASLQSPLILESDANKILQLMKTLCGRMHGILFYRPIGTTAWHSGYCAINVAPGSLVCQTKGDVCDLETLIPDLRGCTVRTHYDAQAQSAHLSVVLPVSGFGYQLRPPVPETFESWLAALLCWQPLKPKGVHNKMAKAQPLGINDRQSVGNRRLSDISNHRGTAVIKSSQLLLWDGALPAGSQRHHAKRTKLSPHEQHNFWRRVNCTLHENGTLRLLSEENATPIRSVSLNNLVRCAVQRLDESVLSATNCIAIHPQYTTEPQESPITGQLILSFSSRVAFEAWYVLLQAMTVPELYGPEIDPATLNSIHHSDTNANDQYNMFRIERSLTVKVVEARFIETFLQSQNQSPQIGSIATRGGDTPRADVYADILLGRDLRARTVAKPSSNTIFWAEEFSLIDIPSMLSRISIVLKMGNPDEREWTMVANGEYDLSAGIESPDLNVVEIASHDPVYGRIEVPLQQLEQSKFVEKWWLITDNNGIDIGQVLIKLCLEENIVLMESEYVELFDLLHNFHNSLTSQLGQVLGTELKQLSDVLLDIFQASGRVEDWISNLIDEEIDGIYREQQPFSRARFSGRIHSNDSYDSVEQRELLVRDLNRSAITEVNQLFRGNSLVSKVLDSHMRRVGKDYLERTLGDKLRSIVANNPNCEVDPNRVRSNEQLDKNWSMLIGLTSSIWESIAGSVDKCPVDIRAVLKHLRSCAEDRYGRHVRTVKYTSVSGFLFLRFFCPAILNGKLFGLLDGKYTCTRTKAHNSSLFAEHPPEGPRRTFTLIAKSLIGLANMSKFGQKEPWMEPMNKFLTTATPDFKRFIDKVCSWDATQNIQHEAQYQAAFQVKTRLPPLSREGLPTLPFLLDAPKSMATLIDLWIDNAPSNIIDTGIDECVQNFHRTCLKIRKRTQDCMAMAEGPQEPNTELEGQWQRMLSEQPRGRFVFNPFENMMNDHDITALPQTPDVSLIPISRYHASRRADTDGSSSADRRLNMAYRPVRTVTDPTASSSTSVNTLEEYHARQIRSRDGPRRPQFLDIYNSASKQQMTGEMI